MSRLTAVTAVLLLGFVLPWAGARPNDPPPPAPAGKGRLDVGMGGHRDEGFITSTKDRADGTRVLHGLQVKFGPKKSLREYAVYNEGFLEQRTQFYPSGLTFRHERYEHDGGGHVVVNTPDESKVWAEKVVVADGTNIGPLKTQDTIAYGALKAGKPWDGTFLAWEPVPGEFGQRLVIQEYRKGEKLKSTPFPVEKLGFPKEHTRPHQWPWHSPAPAP